MQKYARLTLAVNAQQQRTKWLLYSNAPPSFHTTRGMLRELPDSAAMHDSCHDDLSAAPGERFRGRLSASPDASFQAGDDDAHAALGWPVLPRQPACAETRLQSSVPPP